MLSVKSDSKRSRDEEKWGWVAAGHKGRENYLNPETQGASRLAYQCKRAEGHGWGRQAGLAQVSAGMG